MADDSLRVGKAAYRQQLIRRKPFRTTGEFKVGLTTQQQDYNRKKTRWARPEPLRQRKGRKVKGRSAKKNKPQRQSQSPTATLQIHGVKKKSVTRQRQHAVQAPRYRHAERSTHGNESKVGKNAQPLLWDDGQQPEAREFVDIAGDFVVEDAPDKPTRVGAHVNDLLRDGISEAGSNFVAQPVGRQSPVRHADEWVRPTKESKFEGMSTHHRDYPPKQVERQAQAARPSTSAIFKRPPDDGSGVGESEAQQAFQGTVTAPREPIRPKTNGLMRGDGAFEGTSEAGSNFVAQPVERQSPVRHADEWVRPTKESKFEGMSTHHRDYPPKQVQRQAQAVRPSTSAIFKRRPDDGSVVGESESRQAFQGTEITAPREPIRPKTNGLMRGGGAFEGTSEAGSNFVAQPVERQSPVRHADEWVRPTKESKFEGMSTHHRDYPPKQVERQAQAVRPSTSAIFKSRPDDGSVVGESESRQAFQGTVTAPREPIRPKTNGLMRSDGVFEGTSEAGSNFVAQPVERQSPLRHADEWVRPTKESKFEGMSTHHRDYPPKQVEKQAQAVRPSTSVIFKRRPDDGSGVTESEARQAFQGTVTAPREPIRPKTNGLMRGGGAFEGTSEAGSNFVAQPVERQSPVRHADEWVRPTKESKFEGMSTHHRDYPPKQVERQAQAARPSTSAIFKRPPDDGSGVGESEAQQAFQGTVAAPREPIRPKTNGLMRGGGAFEGTSEAGSNFVAQPVERQSPVRHADEWVRPTKESKFEGMSTHHRDYPPKQVERQAQVVRPSTSVIFKRRPDDGSGVAESEARQAFQGTITAPREPIRPKTNGLMRGGGAFEGTSEAGSNFVAQPVERQSPVRHADEWVRPTKESKFEGMSTHHRDYPPKQVERQAQAVRPSTSAIFKRRPDDDSVVAESESRQAFQGTVTAPREPIRPKTNGLMRGGGAFEGTSEAGSNFVAQPVERQSPVRHADEWVRPTNESKFEGMSTHHRDYPPKQVERQAQAVRPSTSAIFKRRPDDGSVVGESESRQAFQGTVAAPREPIRPKTNGLMRGDGAFEGTSEAGSNFVAQPVERQSPVRHADEWVRPTKESKFEGMSTHHRDYPPKQVERQAQAARPSTSGIFDLTTVGADDVTTASESRQAYSGATVATREPIRPKSSGLLQSGKFEGTTEASSTYVAKAAQAREPVRQRDQWPRPAEAVKFEGSSTHQMEFTRKQRAEPQQVVRPSTSGIFNRNASDADAVASGSESRQAYSGATVATREPIRPKSSGLLQSGKFEGTTEASSTYVAKAVQAREPVRQRDQWPRPAEAVKFEGSSTHQMEFTRKQRAEPQQVVRPSTSGIFNRNASDADAVASGSESRQAYSGATVAKREPIRPKSSGLLQSGKFEGTTEASSTYVAKAAQAREPVRQRDQWPRSAEAVKFEGSSTHQMEFTRKQRAKPQQVVRPSTSGIFNRNASDADAVASGSESRQAYSGATVVKREPIRPKSSGLLQSGKFEGTTEASSTYVAKAAQAREPVRQRDQWPRSAEAVKFEGSSTHQMEFTRKQRAEPQQVVRPSTSGIFNRNASDADAVASGSESRQAYSGATVVKREPIRPKSSGLLQSGKFEGTTEASSTYVAKAAQAREPVRQRDQWPRPAEAVKFEGSSTHQMEFTRKQRAKPQQVIRPSTSGIFNRNASDADAVASGSESRQAYSGATVAKREPIRPKSSGLLQSGKFEGTTEASSTYVAKAAQAREPVRQRDQWPRSAEAVKFEGSSTHQMEFTRKHRAEPQQVIRPSTSGIFNRNASDADAVASGSESRQAYSGATIATREPIRPKSSGLLQSGKFEGTTEASSTYVAKAAQAREPVRQRDQWPRSAEAVKFEGSSTHQMEFTRKQRAKPQQVVRPPTSGIFNRNASDADAVASGSESRQAYSGATVATREPIRPKSSGLLQSGKFEGTTEASSTYVAKAAQAREPVRQRDQWPRSAEAVKFEGSSTHQMEFTRKQRAEPQQVVRPSTSGIFNRNASDADAVASGSESRQAYSGATVAKREPIRPKSSGLLQSGKFEGTTEASSTYVAKAAQAREPVRQRDQWPRSAEAVKFEGSSAHQMEFTRKQRAEPQQVVRKWTSRAARARKTTQSGGIGKRNVDYGNRRSLRFKGTTEARDAYTRKTIAFSGRNIQPRKSSIVMADVAGRKFEGITETHSAYRQRGVSGFSLHDNSNSGEPAAVSKFVNKAHEVLGSSNSAQDIDAASAKKRGSIGTKVVGVAKSSRVSDAQALLQTKHNFGRLPEHKASQGPQHSTKSATLKFRGTTESQSAFTNKGVVKNAKHTRPSAMGLLPTGKFTGVTESQHAFLRQKLRHGNQTRPNQNVKSFATSAATTTSDVAATLPGSSTNGGRQNSIRAAHTRQAIKFEATTESRASFTEKKSVGNTQRLVRHAITVGVHGKFEGTTEAADAFKRYQRPQRKPSTKQSAGESHSRKQKRLSNSDSLSLGGQPLSTLKFHGQTEAQAQFTDKGLVRKKRNHRQKRSDSAWNNGVKFEGTTETREAFGSTKAQRHRWRTSNQGLLSMTLVESESDDDENDARELI